MIFLIIIHMENAKTLLINIINQQLNYLLMMFSRFPYGYQLKILFNSYLLCNIFLNDIFNYYPYGKRENIIYKYNKSTIKLFINDVFAFSVWLSIKYIIQ